MKVKIFITLLAALLFNAQVLGNDIYEYVIDLTRVENDRIQVTLTPPDIRERTIRFYLPRIIPGTYSVSDFGRYAGDLKAFDKKGRELAVVQIDDNSWEISKARKMKKITYWIDDTYDDPKDGPKIYPMAGTNIEDGESFVINTPGFVGYFKDMKELPYDIKFIRPVNMYPSTGLIPHEYDMAPAAANLEIEPNDSIRIDQFKTENYHYIVDAPIMYNEPDTAIINVGNTQVLVSSYSPNGIVTSDFLAGQMEEILMAQMEFLGGELPVDKYAFLFYFEELSKLNPVQGALEHSYSSFYYLPEVPEANLRGIIQDIAAHEFFHIVTPLNIHSEEIQYFNYYEPEMSRHLWLYEGVTEYHAHLAQVRQGMISPEEFLHRLSDKIRQSKSSYNDTLAFTELSKHVITEHYAQYANVYQKGALIGMCLDLKLRSLTDGEYGLKDLISDLAEKYGKDRPFKDEELFDVMASLSHPEIKTFMETYVAGPGSLPYDEVFALAGVKYIEKIPSEEYSFGNINLGWDPDSSMVYITSVAEMNEFGRELGYQQGDIIKEVNGYDMKFENTAYVRPTIDHIKSEMQEGDDFVVKVYRENEEDSLELKELKTTTRRVTTYERHVLEWMEDPTEEQLKLRQAWLNQKVESETPGEEGSSR